MATSPYGELPSDLREIEIPLLAERTVDKVVVDGLVDGEERRASIKVLTRIAFQGAHAPDDIFYGFRDALSEEERFVDRVISYYGFRPEISPDSPVRASVIAIVSGQAICSEKEYQETMAFMDLLAGRVYDLARNEDGILSLREVSGTLKAAGFGTLSYDQFGGFLGFMHQDARFYVLQDGRVILTEQFTGSVEELEEVQRLEDFDGAIEAALPSVYTNYSGIFTEGALLGTLKAMGIYIRQDQVRTLFEHLRLSHSVVALNDGRYRKLEVENSFGEKPTVRTMQSLDAMIRHTLGGDSRKPRSKRRGGWKRVQEM